MCIASGLFLYVHTTISYPPLALTKKSNSVNVSQKMKPLTKHDEGHDMASAGERPTQTTSLPLPNFLVDCLAFDSID